MVDESSRTLYESFLDQLTGVQVLKEAYFSNREAVDDEFRFQGFARQYVVPLDPSERRSMMSLVPSGSSSAGKDPAGEATP